MILVLTGWGGGGGGGRILVTFVALTSGAGLQPNSEHPDGG